MLNYIWTGLIAFSLVFALVSDVRDASNDTYRNEQPLPVIIESDAPFDASARRQAVRVRIDPEQYKAFYGVEQVPAESFEGVVVQGADGREVRFAQGVGLPEPLNTIREVTGSRDNQLLATVGALPDSAGTAFATTVTFRRVRFVKMNAIAGAAFDFAETAVSIALGLIGILALWLGLLRIAEKSGLIELLNRLVQPVLRPIFPEIPKDHPAMGLVALNITANMLGLGNAATPLGIKAMESLQTLNEGDKETATNPMVTLLALNTGSVQLVPPALLVAVMGLQVNQLIFAIIIATLISTTVGVVAAKLLQRTRWYRLDPSTSS